MKNEGRRLIVIGHNFDQVLPISDHVYVRRRGHVVTDTPTAETTGQELVACITGANIQADDRPEDA